MLLCRKKELKIRRFTRAYEKMSVGYVCAIMTAHSKISLTGKFSWLFLEHISVSWSNREQCSTHHFERYHQVRSIACVCAHQVAAECSINTQMGLNARNVTSSQTEFPKRKFFRCKKWSAANKLKSET